jgi:hypothetical protein
MIVKMLGTLGTVGILSINLGEYASFSRVPKGANGTLERNADRTKDKTVDSEQAWRVSEITGMPRPRSLETENNEIIGTLPQGGGSRCFASRALPWAMMLNPFGVSFNPDRRDWMA